MKSVNTVQVELATSEDLDVETRSWCKKILAYLYIRKASYLSEMAWDLGTTEYYLKTVINHLHSLCAIEDIPVHPTCPDRRLLGRVVEMSSRGQGGYAQFCRKRWYGLTGDSYG